MIQLEVLPWLSNVMRDAEVGRIRFEHELKGVTFRDLLEELAQQDESFARVVYDLSIREMRYPAVAAINDQLMEFTGGLETPLSAGDRVVIMATYTGGARVSQERGLSPSEK